MYVGVDIGGTKTLVAVLDEHGAILEHAKFPTPQDYHEFLQEVQKTIQSFANQHFQAGGVAIPAILINRQSGEAVAFANLPWKNVFIGHDLEKICNCPFAVENDAKLGGLSEAMLLKGRYKKVLYITVSTGIGIALIDNLRIDPSIGDGGGANMPVEYKGQFVPWESFASGKAIVERFGKRASDIDDEATWQIICRDLAKGLIEVIALAEPDVVVIGGSVGTHFHKYGQILAAELQKYHLPSLVIPPLAGAQRPEEAVVYGCYDYAKQVFAHAIPH